MKMAPDNHRGSGMTHICQGPAGDNNPRHEVDMALLQSIIPRLRRQRAACLLAKREGRPYASLRIVGPWLKALGYQARYLARNPGRVLSAHSRAGVVRYLGEALAAEIESRVLERLAAEVPKSPYGPKVLRPPSRPKSEDE